MFASLVAFVADAERLNVSVPSHLLDHIFVSALWWHDRHWHPSCLLALHVFIKQHLYGLLHHLCAMFECHIDGMMKERYASLSINASNYSKYLMGTRLSLII